jgi:hypothetical protein
MLAALADLNAYKTQQGISDAVLLAVGDVNQDNAVTNADLQSLLNLLRSGNGAQAVPEPAAWILFTVGLFLSPITADRTRRGSRDGSGKFAIRL